MYSSLSGKHSTRPKSKLRRRLRLQGDKSASIYSLSVKGKGTEWHPRLEPSTFCDCPAFKFSGRARTCKHVQRLQACLDRKVDTVGPSTWSHVQYAGYSLRVPQVVYLRFMGTSMSEDEWADSVLLCAEARWGGEWVPYYEAVRLDEDESYSRDQLDLAARPYLMSPQYLYEGCSN